MARRGWIGAGFVAVLALGARGEDGKPLTGEECLAFARGFAADVGSGNTDAVVDRIDWDALLDRVTAGYDADDKFVRGFRRGFLSERRKPGNLVPAVIEAVGKGGSYVLLRVHEKDGTKRALFRMLHENGVNYHDCILARAEDGAVRVSDIHIFLSGETASATMRRIFLAAAAEASKGFLEKLLGSESELVKHLPHIQRMAARNREGRPAEALRIYRSLPAAVQREKFVLLLRFQAAQGLSDEEQLAAAADMRKHCPGDPCLDLLSLDAVLLRRQYDEALACVDRLDAAVGGDPYSDLLRGNIHYMKGDRAAAKSHAAKAIAAEPTLAPAHWTLVQVALDERDHAETVRLLLRIEQVLKLEFGDLTAVPEYAEFVKSPEYREWLGRNAPK
jgi:hypothetical protein